VLTLSFCTDEKVKEKRDLINGRLELAGFRPTKLSLGIFEFQAAASATTWAEIGNVKGLAADLKRMAATNSVPAEVSKELGELAAAVEDYSSQLAFRDKKLLSAVKTAATAPLADSGPIEAWIYLGRRRLGTGEWAPLSEKITINEGATPTEVRIVKDAVLVEEDPKDSVQTALNGSNNGANVIRLIRSGADTFKIISTQPSKSIGEAEFLWAKISVQPHDLYEVRR
jgi:hypothetical protein